MKAYYADKIVTENGIQEKKYLLVEKGKIVDIKDDVEKNIDIDYFKDCIIAPGYIDIHTHGALGYEPGYGEEKGLQDWSQFKMEQGVTGFLPSTASIPLEKLKKAVRHIEIVSENSEVTNILGMQMEGPFFSRGEKIGAQNPDYVLDEFPEDFREFMQENNDIIKYLALDPLISDAEEVVSFCVENDIKVSAAHSEILYEDFIEKKEDGYSCLTHSFNGMVGLHHRNPGLAYPACMDQDLFSEIICDGFHVIYPMLKLFFKLKGYDKAILVTDSMVATGMAPGTSYSLGDIKVTVSEEGKVYKEDGTLAGSTLTLEKAVQNIVKNVGIPVDKAVRMASLNPARMLEIDEKKGSLKSGKDADFIVLDEDLSVEKTYIQGLEVV